MANPKLSVALCTYNGENYILEQLNSIKNQTVMVDEIVICDDRSKDSTIEIIEQFAKTAPFKVVCTVNEKNLGSTKNFEEAMKKCTGDIIFLSDQDDIWLPHKVERILSTFEKENDISFVFTNAVMVNQHLVDLGYTLWEAIDFNRKKKKQVRNTDYSVLLRSNIATGATMAFRREYLNDFVPIPGVFVHDEWIVYILFAYYKCGMINECLIEYRQHPKQQIGAHKVRSVDRYLKLMKQFFNNKELYKETTNKSLLRDIERLQFLYERISNHQEQLHDKRILSSIQDKISHIRVRANLPRSFFVKFYKITKELITLRYHKYANGFKSYVRDLFI